MAEKSEDKTHFSLFRRVNQTAGKEAAPSEAKTEPVTPPSPPSQPAPNNNTEEAMRRLEQELFKEKEKALKAEIILKERENVRLEMEQMFQAMKDQMKEEKLSQGIEVELASARGRVEALEKRLDEMNQLFLKALGVKEEIGQLRRYLEDNMSAAGRQFEKITNDLATGDGKHAGMEKRLDEVAKTCSDLKDLDAKLAVMSNRITGLEERSERLNEVTAKTCARIENIDGRVEETTGSITSLEQKLVRVTNAINRLETGLNDERKSMECLNQDWSRDKTEMSEKFFNRMENMRLETDNIVKILREELEADNLSQNTAIKENLLKVAGRVAGIEEQISEIKALLPITLADEIKNIYACIGNVFQTVKAELREYVYAMDSQGIVSPKILDRKNELIELMTKINIEIGRLHNEFLKTSPNTPPPTLDV